MRQTPYLPPADELQRGQACPGFLPVFKWTWIMQFAENPWEINDTLVALGAIRCPGVLFLGTVTFTPLSVPIKDTLGLTEWDGEGRTQTTFLFFFFL